MNAYPRLSEKAYKNEYEGDGQIHTEEVVDMIAEYAADMWRYYKGKSLNEEEIKNLSCFIVKGLPSKEKQFDYKTINKEESRNNFEEY